VVSAPVMLMDALIPLLGRPVFAQTCVRALQHVRHIQSHAMQQASGPWLVPSSKARAQAPAEPCSSQTCQSSPPPSSGQNIMGLFEGLLQEQRSQAVQQVRLVGSGLGRSERCL
jgi:hypothetical protein